LARFLITGGAGYVGSQTVKALTEAGHQCIVYDDLSSGHRDFVQWGPLIKADIRDESALARAFEYPIDAVFHFAARAYVGESVLDPSRYYDINIHGTRCLLDAMRRANVPALVFSSSCAIYGAHEDPVTERHAQSPINPYGFTKLACERMLDDYGAAYGLRSVRLRYFNAAGADPGGLIGEHHEPEPHLIPLVLEVAARRRDALHVLGTDYPTRDGTAIRDFVHVYDLALAHVAAGHYLLEGGSTIALNLGTGAAVSVRELICTAESVTGRNIRTIDSPRRHGDPAILCANAELASRVLGWAPERSDLPTILKDAWAWSRKRFGDFADRTELKGSGPA
jgi:UDP-arabinose 4-epimerase